jgi:hypothetical protein
MKMGFAASIRHSAHTDAILSKKLATVWAVVWDLGTSKCVFGSAVDHETARPTMLMT